jgi:hypothetical protein
MKRMMRKRPITYRIVDKVVVRHHTLDYTTCTITGGGQKVTIATLSGVPIYYIFRIKGICKDRESQYIDRWWGHPQLHRCNIDL